VDIPCWKMGLVPFCNGCDTEMGHGIRPIRTGISDRRVSSISSSIAGSELIGGDNGADGGVAMLILPKKVCSTTVAVLLTEPRPYRN
jgi:hypothetical protein